MRAGVIRVAVLAVRLVFSLKDMVARAGVTERLVFDISWFAALLHSYAALSEAHRKLLGLEMQLVKVCISVFCVVHVYRD